MPSHKRKQQPNQPKGDKNNKKLKNNSISKTNSMNYVIEHPPYLNRYNVPKILACQKQELQHVWSFKTTPDVVLGHSVVDIYDDQIDHHGSGVIYISAKDYILVLNGHNGQLLKKIGSFLFGHGAGLKLVLDGNRNLLACEYKRTHKLITRDGHIIMKIKRHPITM
ncbi:hypothetical protein C9374_006485 [Naegleria lovaniensis]|uniref:Uncharacterized protein n=1 Tax=Naegleria lovaniensis TaxID=51637 RepID=A0AA88GIB5_NAELO|nr:uncharacterized protein C9374_006485 [Naegleria lovaniensis]KAG2381496.1 hypothetical protein C9374_006485 [Naegleria lovaniensis]